MKVVPPAKGANVLLVTFFAYAIFVAPLQADASSWLSRFITSRLQVQTLSSTFDNVLGQPPSLAPSPSPLSSSTPSSSPAPAPETTTTSPQAAPAPAPQSSSPSQAVDQTETEAPNQVSVADDPALSDICAKTDYPELCRSSVFPFLKNNKVPIDHTSILKLTIDACIDHTQTAIKKATELAASSSPDNMEIIQVCQESYSTAMDALQESALALASKDMGTFRTKMSSVITNIGTCDETFGEDPEMEESSSSPLATVDQTIMHLASNILVSLSHSNVSSLILRH